jgi:quercetin dioxygenase-like cupin family protein
MTSISSPAVLAWGMGEPIAGTPFRQMVSTAETDGHLVLLAVDMASGVYVDEHVHEIEDQITVVVDGTLGATVGDREYSLGPGSVLLMPRAVPHAQWNASSSPARVLEIYTPGGFEEVFRRGGQLAIAGNELGPDAFERLREDWANAARPPSDVDSAR